MASKEAIQAEKLYREGMAPAEIAKTLGKPLATISSWKRRHGWDGTATQRNVAPKPQCNATPDALPAMVKAVEENTELSQAEKDFCLHYSYRPSASRAYRMANPGCTPGTAKTEGWQWFAKPCIKAEINRLNRIKREKMLETVAGDEAQVFQMMWDITFSDMADFAEWGQYEQQIMTMYGPLFETNEETGEKSPVTKMVNDVRFVDSAQVDGTLVAEVKKGKDGAGIKLASKDKALAWLLDYFELNPSDVHRREFDKRRLELESLKIATAQGGTEQPATDDGFLAALDSEAGQMWNGDTPDDSREEWKADDELDTG